MESHIRIKFTANMIALQQLDCPSFTVLMYLAGRASKYGTCFPYPITIAKHIGICIDSVYKALDQLEECKYIKYLRRAFYNRFSNESTPPLFQVSPYFLDIASDCIEKSLLSWHENGNTVFSVSNQQQEPALENNTSNQHQETTTTKTTAKSDSDEKQQTAKSEKQKATAQPPNSAPQQKSESSALVKKFTNPTGIAQPLPDALSERLAERINAWKIPMPLARGLIVKFGYDNVDKAANYTEFCAKMQEIQTLAGFFRTTLETNTHDIELVEAVNKKRHEYDDFIES